MKVIGNVLEMATTEVTIQLLQTKLDKILKFLKPYSGITGCLLRTHFTEDLWTHHVPIEIRQEINSVDDVHTAIELYWEQFKNGFSNQMLGDRSLGFVNFCNYITQAQEHTLEKMPDLWLTPEQLKMQFGYTDEAQKLNINGFMSQKKQHEVNLESLYTFVKT